MVVIFCRKKGKKQTESHNVFVTSAPVMLLLPVGVLRICHRSRRCIATLEATCVACKRVHHMVHCKKWCLCFLSPLKIFYIFLCFYNKAKINISVPDAFLNSLFVLDHFSKMVAPYGFSKCLWQTQRFGCDRDFVPDQRSLSVKILAKIMQSELGFTECCTMEAEGAFACSNCSLSCVLFPGSVC